MNYQIRIARVARNKKSDVTKKTIYLRIFPLWDLRGSDFTLSSRLTIDESKWNDTKKSAKGTSTESQRLNFQLQKLEDQVHALFNEYLKINQNPDVNEFKAHLDFKLFHKGTGIQKQYFVSDIFDRYVKLHSSSLGDKRKLRFKFVGKRVNELNIELYETDKVELKVLTHEWYYMFKEFMLDKFEYHPNTLTGYLKILRSAVREAHKSGYIDRYPFDGCKLEYGEEDIKYLNENELQSILEFRSEEHRLQLVADCFIFASQTGLAHGDMRTLTKSMIRYEGMDLVIEKSREKTSVKSIIPLNELAISILNKYKSDPRISGTDLVLPVIHLNDYNQLLKRIADQCGLNPDSLTSHVARHTFATTVWLAKEGSLEVLQSILGHNNIRTTQRYGKITSKRVASEASKVFARPSEEGSLYLDKKMLNALMNAN